MERNYKDLVASAKNKKKDKNFTDALTDLLEANRIHPNNSEILTLLGEVKRLLNMPEESLQYLLRANELEPNNADTLRFLGATRRKLRDFEGALRDLNQANELKQKNAFILRHRGAVRRLLKDDAGALEDLISADKLSPKNAFTLQHLNATLRSLGNLNDALTVLEAADSLNPNQAFTLRHLGSTKRLLGRYADALADLTRSYNLDSEHAFTLKQLAMTKAQLGNYEGGLRDIQEALRIDPENQEAQSLKLELELAHVRREGVVYIPFENLTFTRTLGEGGFGVVSLASWGPINVAIKQVTASRPLTNLTQEAKTLVLLRYKYIVGLMGVSADPTTSALLLVMEYYRHGSLHKLLFQDNVHLLKVDVIQLALDIAKGLTYLHAQTPKVIHRDLKSENVLLWADRKRAKIADFGTAKFALENNYTVVGTPLLAIPPEMLAEESYNEKVDIFSFGVLLYEMLTNRRLPVLEAAHRERRIIEGVADIELRQIILDCCHVDPTQRPSAHQLVERLKRLKREIFRTSIN